MPAKAAWAQDVACLLPVCWCAGVLRPMQAMPTHHMDFVSHLLRLASCCAVVDANCLRGWGEHGAGLVLVGALPVDAATAACPTFLAGATDLRARKRVLDGSALPAGQSVGCRSWARAWAGGAREEAERHLSLQMGLLTPLALQRCRRCHAGIRDQAFWRVGLRREKGSCCC